MDKQRPGFGAKFAAVFEELGIDTVDDLREGGQADESLSSREVCHGSRVLQAGGRRATDEAPPFGNGVQTSTVRRP